MSTKYKYYIHYSDVFIKLVAILLSTTLIYPDFFNVRNRCLYMPPETLRESVSRGN